MRKEREEIPHHDVSASEEEFFVLSNLHSHTRHVIATGAELVNGNEIEAHTFHF